MTNAPDDAVAGYAPVGHGPDRARGTVPDVPGRPRPMLATWRSDMVPREIIETKNITYNAEGGGNATSGGAGERGMRGPQSVSSRSCHSPPFDTRAISRVEALLELLAGAAAVVAIGVGSPVASLGAHGHMRREARGAAVRAVGAVGAVCVFGAGLPSSQRASEL